MPFSGVLVCVTPLSDDPVYRMTCFAVCDPFLQSQVGLSNPGTFQSYALASDQSRHWSPSRTVVIRVSISLAKRSELSASVEEKIRL